MTDTLRFDRPPVREVTLALMLEPLSKLQTLDLAPLRVEWRSEYPILQEATPQAPWRAADRDGVEFVRSGLAWPMGLCTFSTASGDKSVRFQQDRFMITWSFGEESPEYPGFATLKNELLSRFAEYCKLAAESAKSVPVVRRVDVQYVNLIQELSAQDAMAGILTGWSSPAQFPFRNPDYSGFRIHYHESELNPNVNVLIGVDSAGGESPEGEFTSSSTLTLEAEGQVDADSDYVEMLEASHGVLTSAFLEVTSDSMRKNWGEVK
ncbi:TIGR04255 family protein [Streptomyces sp. NPDC047434]|uniref:TIGR04255 family protein n=1 Tax=Streptomyces sp. NPDC047434 TaxID=3155143 RepID=UPI0033C5FB3B